MTTTTKTAKTATASKLTASLEGAWRAIQKVHPEIPDVVVVIGPVSMSTGKADKYGHYAPSRWTVDGERRHEVLIAAEGLNRGARQVFRTLLHESVHASCAVRELKDTTQRGRHNDVFRTEAESFGLKTAAHPTIGTTTPDVTDETAERYAKAIAGIDAALRLYRREELDGELLDFARFLIGLLHLCGHATDGDGPAALVPRRRHRSARAGNNAVKLTCGCGRSIRAFPATVDEGSIVCGVCGEDFA